MLGIIGIPLDLLTKLGDKDTQILQLVDMIGAPYLPEQVLMGEHLAYVPAKEGQQRILGGRQLKKLVIFFTVRVDRSISSPFRWMTGPSSSRDALRIAERIRASSSPVRNGLIR